MEPLLWDEQVCEVITNCFFFVLLQYIYTGLPNEQNELSTRLSNVSGRRSYKINDVLVNAYISGMLNNYQRMIMWNPNEFDILEDLYELKTEK